ncbi:MAG: hypothetical protein SGILL_010127 [Bacillariaceae sp.]
MKSWADHCSSDEEDDSIADDTHQLATEFADNVGVVQEEPISEDEIVGVPNEPPPKTYDFPSQPPYTAFVGNLSFQIKDVPQFVEAVTNLAKDRLEEPVNILGGRIAYNRTDPSKHRGFGYVEVETLDQLKLMMTLNDGQSMIAGRNVQLDTANHHNNSNNNRRGSHQNNNNNNRGSFQRGGDRGSFSRDSASGGGGFGEIDGSKFRGGKYNNSNRGGDNNKRRGSNRDSFNSHGGGGDTNQGDKPQESSGPPAQRPSLKLAPRSKAVDTDRSSGSSNIFGGATARDNMAWEERRASMKKEQPKEDKPADAVAKTEGGEKAGGNPKEKRSSHQDRRQSGRGRGGRGRGGRGGRDDDKGGDQQNKRGSRRNSQQDKKQQKPQTDEEKAAAIAAAAVIPDAAPKKTEASNKFALLMDSDSE